MPDLTDFSVNNYIKRNLNLKKNAGNIVCVLINVNSTNLRHDLNLIRSLTPKAILYKTVLAFRIFNFDDEFSPLAK